MRGQALWTLGAWLMLSSPASAQPLPGERFTPPARGERHTDTLKVGDTAPVFTLPAASGSKETALASFRGQKPVVLIFGSCT